MTTWLEVAIALLVAYAALHDVIARTIPDIAPIAVAVLGAALRAASGDILPGIAMAGVVGVILVGLHVARLVGGGDVKLLAAAALATPPADVLPLLLATTIAGGFLALMALAARRLIRRIPTPAGRAASLPQRAWRAEAWRLRRGGPIPYAVAILVGVLFTKLT